MRFSHGGIIRLFVAGLLLPLAAPALSAPKDPRIVEVPASQDTNRDRISDRLQQGASASGLPGTQTSSSDLIVALDHAPTAADRAQIAKLGGKVQGEWRDLVYALHVQLPSSSLVKLSKLSGVVFVDQNRRCHKTLYYSTRQTRARQVWGMGFEGSPNYTIAVLDTGIDDSHPDLSGRIVAWADFAGVSATTTGDEYSSPTDKGEHGSHVAGIVGGSGAVAGISSGVGTLPITQSLYFSNQIGSGYLLFFPIDTTGATAASTVTARLKWAFTSDSSRSNTLQIRNPSGVVATGSKTINGAQPLTVSYASVPMGALDFGWNCLAVTGRSNNNTAYWLQTASPVSAAGDGRSLNRGMAPACGIAGVKVLDDSGEGTDTTILNGLTWVQDNRLKYHIVAANMSLGYEEVVPAIDTAVNNLVSQGVVCVAAAGNSRDSSLPNIYSPGSASKCISVGAINDLDQVTEYSSFGASGTSRPDVCAPGGSSVTHRLIISVDSNDTDYTINPLTMVETHFADAFSNDYQGMQGTSMATPHVSGLVGLIANALGSWDYSEANALRVKMLISMTATETNDVAELTPDPTLQRGAKDTSEGFGRINADAAVEAATMSYKLCTEASAQLGAGPTEKKAWARKVNLLKGVPYTFSLAVPDGADYDLYLYQSDYSTTSAASNASAGDPIIAKQSCLAATGGTEQIQWTPSVSGTYYLVVKEISGGGAFQLNSTGGSTFSSPTGYVKLGWNLIGLPATPLNPDPAVVLAGIDAGNASLQFWRNDVDGGGYLSYPTEWSGPMQPATAYWFINTDSAKTLSFQGLQNTSDWQIQIPAHSSAPFWVLIAHPFEHNTDCANIKFSNTLHPTPVNWRAAGDLGMVEYSAQGFDMATHGFFSAGPSGLLVDRTKLEPWHGYWLMVRQPQALTITIPVSPAAP